MEISAQVSLYPLGQADLLPSIQALWEALEKAGLNYRAGPMSTLVSGPDQAVLEALRQGFQKAAELGQAVMVVTLSNACPIDGEEGK